MRLGTKSRAPSGVDFARIGVSISQKPCASVTPPPSWGTMAQANVGLQARAAQIDSDTGRTSSEMRRSSAIWNGGVFASLRIGCRAPALRPRRSPASCWCRANAAARRADADDELRRASWPPPPASRLADDDREMPPRSRTSVKVTPPRSRTRCTAEQHDVGADVGGAQRAAGMGACEIAERFRHAASRESSRSIRAGAPTSVRRCRSFNPTSPRARSSSPEWRRTARRAARNEVLAKFIASGCVDAQAALAARRQRQHSARVS